MIQQVEAKRGRFVFRQLLLDLGFPKKPPPWRRWNFRAWLCHPHSQTSRDSTADYGGIVNAIRVTRPAKKRKAMPSHAPSDAQVHRTC